MVEINVINELRQAQKGRQMEYVSSVRNNRIHVPQYLTGLDVAEFL